MNNTSFVRIHTIKFSFNFSFSGIKSAVMNLVNNEKQRGNDIIKEDLACSFQTRVVSVIVKKTLRAVNDYNVLAVRHI